MATTFVSMAYEMSAFLPGCPSLAIENTIRKYAIDLCRWGKVWRGDMTQITLVDGTYQYAVSSADANARFDQPTVAYTTIGTTKTFLKIRTYTELLSEYPSWPGDSDGSPVVITTRDPGYVMLAPVPDAAGTLDIFGTLVPTSVATEWDTAMYDEHRDVLFHGVLYELMAMPGRSWSDLKESLRHEKRWSYLRASARAVAERQYAPRPLSVEMTPAA